MKSCVILLADFNRNFSHTNHCAAKLLHRIAFDHHMVALLFQARLFRIFARLLYDPVYQSAAQYQVTTLQFFVIFHKCFHCCSEEPFYSVIVGILLVLVLVLVTKISLTACCEVKVEARLPCFLVSHNKFR